ncbi:MAG: GNAT family N-acetyltransferase [Rhodobacterales bacterium]|nr:GNAT family N-acetyltransferase [Rhodobacterales bacterium]NCT13098.1 GNAT family N-acetyltransferase [Rhodobacterales bacterium]
MNPMLQTERLVLRRPLPGDWPAFHDFMMSDRSTAFGSHGNLGRAFRAFAAELGHWEIFGYGMWAVTRRGEETCIGLVGPWTPPDWPEREVGWMILSAAAEGTGIATEAARAAIAHAYGTLGWDTVVSYIGPENVRSARLAEKLGARRDAEAPQPYPDAPVLVYRHPRPEARA